jgi:hypothetical protein
MDHSPHWVRPDLKPRLRRSSLVVGVLALGAGALALWLSRETTTVIPVITPVTVHVPAAAPQITMPTPEVKVTVPPPPPSEPSTPHGLGPKLSPDCIVPGGSDAMPTTDGAGIPCSWDDGFPAISEDGSLIAIKASPDPGPRGGSSLYVQLLDTKTSRIVRSDEILSIDESFVDDKGQAALRENIRRRVALVQSALDARHFRRLILLGASHEGHDGDEPKLDATKLHAEIAGGAVRIIDPAASLVLWQGAFGAPAPKGRSEDGLCFGWGLNRIAVWWDPTTKYVLARLSYRTGGCMCTDEEIVQIKRI